MCGVVAAPGAPVVKTPGLPSPALEEEPTLPLSISAPCMLPAGDLKAAAAFPVGRLSAPSGQRTIRPPAAPFLYSPVTSAGPLVRSSATNEKRRPGSVLYRPTCGRMNA